MTSFHEAKRQKAKEERQARGQKRMMEKLDTNQDGVISAEEFSTGPRGVFKRLDTDEDGVITEAERDAAKERMKDHRGKRGERRGRD
jgi:Ca2+-binding EF-hand superfamily protein